MTSLLCSWPLVSVPTVLQRGRADTRGPALTSEVRTGFSAHRVSPSAGSGLLGRKCQKVLRSTWDGPLALFRNSRGFPSPPSGPLSSQHGCSNPRLGGGAPGGCVPRDGRHGSREGPRPGLQTAACARPHMGDSSAGALLRHWALGAPRPHGPHAGVRCPQDCGGHSVHGQADRSAWPAALTAATRFLLPLLWARLAPPGTRGLGCPGRGSRVVGFTPCVWTADAMPVTQIDLT